eukprot:6180485-Pleurochrysis_carterae.AAC.7
MRLSASAPRPSRPRCSPSSGAPAASCASTKPKSGLVPRLVAGAGEAAAAASAAAAADGGLSKMRSMMAQMFMARPGLEELAEARLPLTNWYAENHVCSGLRSPLARMSKAQPMASRYFATRVRWCSSILSPMLYFHAVFATLSCKQCMPSTMRNKVPVRTIGADR